MADLTPRRQNRELFPELTEQFGTLFNHNFWSPFQGMNKFKTDVRDDGKHYVVEAELPGFQKEDIHVEYDEPNLIIKAVREEQENENDQNYIHQERSYGEFVRTFPLRGIRDEEIDAAFENGLLKLTVPKKDDGKSQGRKIDIH